MTFARHYSLCLLAFAGAFSLLIGGAVACDEVGLVCVGGRACVTQQDGSVAYPTGSPCGACKFGEFDCEQDACVGGRYPTEEVCDGVDNDCDCLTDEVPPLPPGAEGNFCVERGVGACRAGEMRCLDGVLVCSNPVPTPEECDGVDNDCNGEVDDVLITFTYSGPPATVGVGECRPHTEVCLDGRLRVTDEVLPTEKDVCGNGKDDDCDGAVDEPDVPPRPRSVALVVDRSGSMSSSLGDLAWAVCSFANSVQEETWMAVIGVASGTGPEYVEVVADWAPATDICAVLTGLPMSSVGVEHQPDGVMLHHSLSVWPTPDRAVVVFTDELIQDYNYTVDDLLPDCALEDYVLYVVTKIGFFPSWEPAVLACGGDLALLASGPMEDALSNWFKPECARE